MKLLKRISIWVVIMFTAIFIALIINDLTEINLLFAAGYAANDIFRHYYPNKWS